jgi:hypothetical protein
LDRLPGPRGPHPNRVSEEIEKAIASHSLSFPTHGPLRVAQQMNMLNRSALKNASAGEGCTRAEPRRGSF